MRNKEFIFVFLPITAMVGALIFLFFLADVGNERQIIETAERTSVNFAVELLQEDISDAVSDIEILSSSQVFNDYTSAGKSSYLPAISHLFAHYSEGKRTYESISFLGLDGMENIRINYNNGAPLVTPDEDLVSRKNSGFFKEAITLSMGQTYMTFPEEIGAKSETRDFQRKSILFLSPVFDASSTMVGVLMIEYKVSTLASRLLKVFTNITNTFMIADIEGRWLLPPVKSDNGHDTGASTQEPAHTLYKDAWSRIKSSPSGQFHTDMGLFTFANFYSPKAVHHHVTSGDESAARKTWKIISLVPDEMVNLQSRKLSARLVILYAIFIIFIAGVLKLLDRRFDKSGDPQIKMVSPKVLIGITIVIVFTSEFIVMLALQAAPHMNRFSEAALDATLLSLLILPMVSILLFRPLMGHIHDRQIKEEELKRSEEYVRAIIKSVGEGIVVFDEHMKIRMVNEELINIFGYTEDELLYKNVFILAPIVPNHEIGEFNPKDSTFFKSLMTAIGRRIKVTGRRKNGESFHLEARMEETSGIDGESIYVGAVRDITDEELAQKALAESEEKFRSSFENAAIGMVLTSTEGQFLQVNSAFCSMLGYTRVELLSKTFGQITYAEDLEEDMSLVSKSLTGELDSFRLEKRYIHKKGDIVWVLLNAAIVRDDNKAPRFFIAQIEDITERKETELELIKAKEEAEESTLLKDKFVSLVAHDLRSPFVSITGLLKLMLAEDGKELSEKHALMLRTALNAGEQSVALIDELLNISRLKTGVITPQRKFMDAHTVALIAISSLSHIAAGKNVSIENHVREGTRIFADPRLYTEVITNLLSNAIKFSHSGSTVLISSLQDGRVGLSVKDFGIGVNKDYLDKLFRYDEKTHTRGTLGETGTGLGLPLSYDIMLAHDGTLECALVEDGGSMFLAVLPDVTPRILVVEQEQAITEQLQTHLADNKVEFITAQDYDTARAALDKSQVHLVIADLGYDPELGLEFIAYAAGGSKSHEIPTIAITTPRQALEAQRALNAGATDFVTKPLDMEALLARARRIIL